MNPAHKMSGYAELVPKLRKMCVIVPVELGHDITIGPVFTIQVLLLSFFFFGGGGGNLQL